MMDIATNIISSFTWAILKRLPFLKRWIPTSKKKTLNKRIRDSGITNVYTSRDDFAKYREAPKLIDYLNLAEKEIYICAYWMAHGTEMEGIDEKIARLTKPPKKLNINIAIINPKSLYLESLANYLNIDTEEVRQRISKSLKKLFDEKEKLAPDEKARFTIKVYDAFPIASVIMLDPYHSNCRLQFEIKPYKKARHYSFSFELRNEISQLYQLCSEAWLELIKDAEEFNPSKHLDNNTLIQDESV